MKNINNITDNTTQAVYSADSGINAMTGSQPSITIMWILTETNQRL